MLIALAGCSTSFTARHYPSFYDPNIQTVAVVPFTNETNTQGAGALVADSLARALQANGTYRVLTPRQLRSLMAQNKLTGLSRSDNQKDIEAFRQLGGVQAFITGTVRQDTTISAPYPDGYAYPPPEIDDELGDDFGDDLGDSFDDDPYYPYGPYGYWGAPYYDPAYPEYFSHAHVSLEASLVRVSDGAVLYHTTAPVEASADLRSYREIMPRSATVDALSRASAKLVRDLAVVPMEVQANTRTGLKTALGSEADGWTFTSKFSRDDAAMSVVIDLPATVAHNTFRLIVTRREKPDDIILSKDFRWPSGSGQDAVTLSPKKIADSAGPGRYTVSFHAMGVSVMQHNFSIQ